MRSLFQFMVLLAAFSLTLGTSGCGDSSNTVEMPKNPTSSPGRPAAGDGDPGSTSVEGAEAMPAVEP